MKYCVLNKKFLRHWTYTWKGEEASRYLLWGKHCVGGCTAMQRKGLCLQFTDEKTEPAGLRSQKIASDWPSLSSSKVMVFSGHRSTRWSPQAPLPGFRGSAVVLEVQGLLCSHQLSLLFTIQELSLHSTRADLQAVLFPLMLYLCPLGPSRFAQVQTAPFLFPVLSPHS